MGTGILIKYWWNWTVMPTVWKIISSLLLNHTGGHRHIWGMMVLLNILLMRPHKISVSRARHGDLVVKVLTLNTLPSHMGNGSNPSSSTSHPAPCLSPGKADEDGPKPWEPASAWQTWRKFLAPGSWLCGLAQYRPLWSIGKWVIGGKSSSLSLLLSVYLTFQYK